MLRMMVLVAALAAAGTAHAQEAPDFTKLDADADGRVTMSESSLAFYSVFDRFDADKDAGLNRAEFDAATAHMKRRAEKGPAFKAGEPTPLTHRAFKTALQKFVTHHELDGAALIVGDEKGPKLTLYAGSYTPGTVRNIASSSKWVAGLMVADVVARTDLDYTTTVGAWRPALASAPVGAATFEHLMSFTAGAPGLAEGGAEDVRLAPDAPFIESAEKLVASPLKAAPGTRFAYGSWSQQVAGAWAAEAAGETWPALFNRVLATPLGLKDSYWSTIVAAPENLEVTSPLVQGGLWSSPRDLVAIVRMVANDGSYEGKTVLERGVVRSLERDLIGDKAGKLGSEAGVMKGFGIGIWCEAIAADGTCPVVSSPGAWGSYTWVDRNQGLWGVFVTLDRGERVNADFLFLRRAAEAYVARR